MPAPLPDPLPAPLPIVIDTDIGADPDDAFALALALASPEVAVVGVTVVDGDVALRARMAARLLGLAGRPDVSVFVGASRPLGPGRGPTMLGTEGQGLLDLSYDGPEATVQAEPAVDWLVAEARRRPFHLVAIGPPTNVAAAIRRDPAFAPSLLGLTLMGGVWDEARLPAGWRQAVRELGAFAAWPDHNTASDPVAAIVCAEAPVPQTWVTVEATMGAPLRRAALDRLPDAPLTRALRAMTEVWVSRWYGGFMPADDDTWTAPADTLLFLHDPLAVAAVRPREWLELQRVRTRAEIADGVFRLRPAGDETGQAATVSVAVDGPRFEAFCLDRIAALAARAAVGGEVGCPPGGPPPTLDTPVDPA